MARKILAGVALVVVALLVGYTVADAQLVRDNKVRMAVERTDGNRHPLTPNLTMYSNSDTLSLALVVGDSLSEKTQAIGLVGPVAWAVLEIEEDANSLNLWFRCKELEDGKRVGNAGQDTTQYYAWGNWTCVILNGVAKDVPLNSIGLADSIKFYAHGGAHGPMLINLRQELIAPTWMPSDAAN